MWRFIVRRSLLAIPTLFAVFSIVFFAIRIVPGDPAVAALGNHASAATLQAFRESMGLNEPLWQQYVDFLQGLVTLDFGTSMISGRSISGDIAAALPYTMELTAAGILVGVLLGVPLGVLSGRRRGTWIDTVARLFALAGLSIPAFLLGVLLLMAFAVQLDWFPVTTSSSASGLAYYRQLVLPALSIGLIMTAYVMRMTRSSMLDSLGADYVRTARSKGIAERLVVYRHALRNALIPIITVVGLYVGLLIASSVMTEIVFNRPGLGKLILGSIRDRDYNLLQSLMVVYSGFVVAVNLLTDISYSLVDPRIRSE